MENTYTLKDCLFAKKELMRNGFTETDFYEAGKYDLEIGYLIGEPMVINNDDTCKSALELYQESKWGEEDDENMINFYVENDLI